VENDSSSVFNAIRHYANKNLCKFDVGQERLKQFLTKTIEKNVLNNMPNGQY